MRSLTTLKGDETLLVQSGKPVGVMRTHEWAPRVLIANSNLVGDWANWDEFRRLEQLGLTMYGQMTAGSWIYIGTQGILQGTYETFSAVAEQAVRRHPRRHHHPHRRPRRHGRRPAARRHHERRRRDLRRRRPEPHRPPHRAPLPRRRGDVDRARARARLRRPRSRRRRSASACSATRRTSSRGCWPWAPRSTSSPTRPARTTRSPTSRSSIAFDDWKSAREADPAGFVERSRALAWPCTWRRWWASRMPGPRSSTTATTSAPRRRPRGSRDAFAFPGFVPAYIRPLFSAGQGAVPLGRAQRRPGRHLRDRPGDARAVPRERVAGEVDQDGARARALPGAARPHLLARLRRTRPRGAEVQRDGRLRRDLRPRS